MKTEYQLFVCDTSGAHEPVAAFVSDTPYPMVVPGQRFDDHGWDRLRGVGVIASEANPIRYTVHSIKTVIFTEDGHNVVQTGINLDPYSGNRSPAFGSTEPTMTTGEALGRDAEG